MVKKTQDKRARPKRNNVNFILTDAESLRINHEIEKIRESAGIPCKLGTYAKHALLSHDRLRRLEIMIKAEVAACTGNTAPAGELPMRLRSILAECAR